MSSSCPKANVLGRAFHTSDDENDTSKSNPNSKISSSPPSSSSSSSSSHFIRHKVTPADTIVSIAMMYRVTVAEIKSANGLGASNEIWMKSELLIPRRKDTSSIFRSVDQEVVHTAANSQMATALQRVFASICRGCCLSFKGCNEELARRCLEIANGNFNVAASLMTQCKEVAVELCVDVEDVFMHIKMYDDDVNRGIHELRQDVEWEQSHKMKKGAREYIQLAEVGKSSPLTREEKKTR
eukprot:CAMPEP_0113844268 /NCGR_PEP_ID=MMETSP0372-20130328/152_1 /TAXON_ID=340204 /ORGANISM="Lankesteria abbotti" /LENGTH=239 /DNA_ID=CAMNT_0000813271 /DNA_START=321 /DNA_END=1040 /DNA_ORIENTATION=- /assembly_acc=CAM_ASM_000359